MNARGERKNGKKIHTTYILFENNFDVYKPDVKWSNPETLNDDKSLIKKRKAYTKKALLNQLINSFIIRIVINQDTAREIKW